MIPANSDLTYEVKLLFTNDADSMIEAFEAIDYDGDGYLDPNEVIEISIAIKICTWNLLATVSLIQHYRGC